MRVSSGNRHNKNRNRNNKIRIVMAALVGIAILLLIGISYQIGKISNADRQPAAKIAAEYLVDIPEQESTETKSEKPVSEEPLSGKQPDEDAKVLPPSMEVHFLDIGQGDATLIKCGEHAILIDTGSSEAENDILEYLAEQSIDTLDYMIFSHGHEDHMGRGFDILMNMKVEHVICDFGNQEGYVQRLQNLMKDMEIDTIIPKAGDVYKSGDITFTILMGRNTELPVSTEEVTNVNNQSIAVKVTHGDNSFLFYGDGEAEYEKYLISAGIDVKADVLKVAHHGGGLSNGDAILDKIESQYAVISSAPQEAFGYPSNDTLLRIAARQITTFYTNKRGTVKAVSDGGTISWTAEH